MISVAIPNIDCIKGIICRRVQDYGKSTKIEKDEVIKIINAELPSVSQGHWIIMGDRYIRCSECGRITSTESPDTYYYCMQCGRRMTDDVEIER